MWRHGHVGGRTFTEILNQAERDCRIACECRNQVRLNAVVVSAFVIQPLMARIVKKIV